MKFVLRLDHQVKW